MNTDCQCSQLPFSEIFSSSRKPQQWLVGSVDQARENRATCSFCNFLLECYDLAYDKNQQSDLEIAERVEFTLQIPTNMQTDGEEPWFERMGITSESLAGAALWLRFNGIQEKNLEVRDPLICIGLAPFASSHGVRGGILPRTRAYVDSSSSRLDYKQLRAWLGTCDETHFGICRNSSTRYKRRTLRTRLIDVHAREINFPDEDPPYIALSYVWGKSHGRDYNKIWKSVRFDSDIVRLPDKLPQTLEDALEFTKAMGYRYIWIDALCINQHNHAESRSQIASMHLIYECASFSIAAVGSDDARAGLCGVSRDFERTYQPQLKTQLGEFTATYVHDTWSYNGQSKWDQRAWTLQELLLSRRMIFLDKNYPTMRCRLECFSGLVDIEAYSTRPAFVQGNRYFWENGFDVDLTHPEWSFLYFDNLLANYTNRNLTNQADALMACEGALGQITSKTGVAFVHGMPKADFHMALLWKPYTQHSLTRRLGFPTWSWTGWLGRVEHHYCLDEMKGYKAFGADERESMLRQNPQHLTFDQQDKLSTQEAFVVDLSSNMLTISSSITEAPIRMIRKAGETMDDIIISSVSYEQPDEAVGDLWVICQNGQDLRNPVGEVSEFIDIPYSFQVHPFISKWIDKNRPSCFLLFIKYFPFLRDSPPYSDRKWLFDYVGCLVLIKDKTKGGTAPYKRIGCVFISLTDWVKFQSMDKVVNIE